MKVTFVIYSLGTGGAERVTAHLANHWAAKGWAITIVTLCGVDEDSYSLDPSVRRVALDLASESRNWLVAILSNVRRTWTLRRHLRAVKPDIVVGMMTVANVLVALAAPRLTFTIGAERIYPPRWPYGRSWEALRRWAYRRLDVATGLTTESAQWLRHHTHARRIEVIPNPIVWPPPPARPYRDPAVVASRSNHILLAVGRLAPQKGFDLLIEAFYRVASAHPDWNLLIVGEGAERPNLERLVEARALGDRVFLPGQVGNIADWYGIASLYVMSSRFEGFPNTLGEAMACGLPAVSFDCDTGPRDIIRHNVDGLLVPANDVGALAGAMNELICNPALRERLAERAVEVRQRFSLQSISGRWEALIDGAEKRHSSCAQT